MKKYSVPLWRRMRLAKLKNKLISEELYTDIKIVFMGIKRPGRHNNRPKCKGHFLRGNY
jgi:hypothetical protein